MPSEFTDAGDIATGVLIARAVEPEAGEASGPSTAPCLNCQNPLSGAFCSACGQKASVHRTLRGFGHDILHGVLHFDGKIWRTIPLLFFNPGHLTRRYIHGERARFVSPIALFLFCVFLALAVFNNVVPEVAELEAAMKSPQTAQEIAAAKSKTEPLPADAGRFGLMG